MTIFIGSRYENETPFSFSDERGQVRETVLSTRSAPMSDGYRYHIWAETDRVDRLASEYLFDADRWWEIMDANPEILNPMDIEIGQLIRVPNA